MINNTKFLDSKSLKDILNTYDFPHRFLVYFASQCAKDAMSRVKDPDPRSIRAIAVAEGFGNGAYYTEEELKEVADDAYAAARAATSPAYAAYAATSPAAYSVTSAATYAAYYAHAAAAYWASPNRKEDDYKPLLLDLIEKRLTEFEKLMIFN